MYLESRHSAMLYYVFSSDVQIMMDGAVTILLPCTFYVSTSFFLISPSSTTTISHPIMEVTDLLPLLEQLDDNVDDLEKVLEPFLNSSLAKASKTLPVMDKAKLHVLITYTLESLIFCMSSSNLDRRMLTLSQLIYGSVTWMQSNILCSVN